MLQQDHTEKFIEYFRQHKIIAGKIYVIWHNYGGYDTEFCGEGFWNWAGYRISDCCLRSGFILQDKLIYPVWLCSYDHKPSFWWTVICSSGSNAGHVDYFWYDIINVCNNIQISTYSYSINFSSFFLLSYTQPEDGWFKAETWACSWVLYSYSVNHLANQQLPLVLSVCPLPQTSCT